MLVGVLALVAAVWAGLTAFRTLHATRLQGLIMLREALSQRRENLVAETTTEDIGVLLALKNADDNRMVGDPPRNAMEILTDAAIGYAHDANERPGSEALREQRRAFGKAIEKRMDAETNFHHARFAVEDAPVEERPALQKALKAAQTALNHSTMDVHRQRHRWRSAVRDDIGAIDRRIKNIDREVDRGI